MRGTVRVHCDSCFVLGTDHEILEGTFFLRPRQKHMRHSTRPRIWVGGIDRITYLDQASLVDLARRHTRPKPGCAYRDPPTVREATRRAKIRRTGEAWGEVRRLRKQARREWERDRIARASKGDWSAFRVCKPLADTGWIEGFAAAQTGDPHGAVHQHLQQVYKGCPPQAPQSPPVVLRKPSWMLPSVKCSPGSQLGAMGPARNFLRALQGSKGESSTSLSS